MEKKKTKQSFNEQKYIRIRGARTHNLKNINIDIPLNQIVCIAGPSGSGKTSLAFHTLWQESKRRFINSLPTDIKFFWDIPNTVDVDKIEPVCPVWCLPQHNPIVGSRINVCDLSGLTEQLQSFFFFKGSICCPHHHVPLISKSFVNNLKLDLANLGAKATDTINFFIERSLYNKKFPNSIKPSRSLKDLDSEISVFNENDLYWEVTRAKAGNLDKLQDKFKEVLGSDFKEEIWVKPDKSTGKAFRVNLNVPKSCPLCDYSDHEGIKSIDMLSPYNALGACKNCKGYGANLVYDRNKLVKFPNLSVEDGAVSIINFKGFRHLNNALINSFSKNGLDKKTPFKDLPEKKWQILYEGCGRYPGLNSLFTYLESKRYKRSYRIFIRSLQTEVTCEKCLGTRVSDRAKNIRIFAGRMSFSLYEVLLLKLNTIKDFFKSYVNENNSEIGASKLLSILDVCEQLEITYLNLKDKARDLASSEYQRLLLVKYLSYEGSGSLFILDEPSFGLDYETQKLLMNNLKKIIDQNNSVILVDHSDLIQSMSDNVIMMGPGAGSNGGQIIFQGEPSQLVKYKEKWKGLIRNKVDKYKDYIKIKKLTVRDNKEVDIEIPLNTVTFIKGSGSSKKSEYIMEGLGQILSSHVDSKSSIDSDNIKYKTASIPNSLTEVNLLDSKLSKLSSRSTVGTYIGLSPIIRKYFSSLDVSKQLNLTEGHFSPNSELGRCSTCEGRGKITVEMQFLEDVEFTCDDCKGNKIRPYIASISNGNITVHDAFSLPVSTIKNSLILSPKAKRIISYLETLSLDYLSLDRGLDSLSGGERQRLKLLALLQKKITNSVLIFENISFGLSEKEIYKLFELLEKIRVDQNTVILIDHHPLFEQSSDIVVDMNKNM